MAFQELFTVIDDASGETQHPHVHYVFSDDEELTHLALNDSPDHRIVIVDLQDQIKIQSLAPDWQAVKAELTQAPSWGDLSGGMMLKITGKPQRTISADASVEELLEEFDKGMEVLEEVLQDEEMKSE